MNNKGWSLSTLLGFLTLFGIILVLVAILYNESFSNITDKNAEMVSESIEDEIEIDEKKYIEFENKLVKAANKYIEKKQMKTIKNKIIISLNDLINNNLIKEIIDPRTNNKCMGYVIYEEKPKGYVSCIGSYQTYNYDEEFEY